MANFWKAIVVFVAACLLDLASTKHVKRQQVVMSSTPNPRLTKSKDATEGSVAVKLTFDSIDLSKKSNHTLNSVPFVEFERFQVMNSTSGMDKGILNETDMDCAASSPNFVLGIPSEYGSPSIWHTNDKQLEAAGLSKYVDLISFVAKPLRTDDKNAVGGGIDILAWQLDGKDVKNIHQLYIGFYLDEDTGSFEPFPIEPRQYFEGWGEQVNYVEMSGYTMAEDYSVTPWVFCLDDIVFEVREKSGK